jgi:hypothetical protein
MMKANKVFVHKTQVNPEWFTNKDNEKLYDVERQEYVMKHHGKKIEKLVSDKDYDVMMEIMFHILNTNTLITNNVYYNTKHHTINNKGMKTILKDIKDNPEHAFKHIANNFKCYMCDKMNNMVEHIDKDMRSINIYTKNNSIHAQETIYIIIDSGNDDITIYKYVDDNDTSYGSILEELATINPSKTDHMKSIHEVNNNLDEKMTETNTIGMSFTRRFNKEKAAKLMRAIIMTNKWFNDGNSIIFNIHETIFKNKTHEEIEYTFN